MSLAKTNRQLHRLGAIFVAIPAGVIILTGILLQLKKDVPWIQPPTAQGSLPATAEAASLGVSFEDILGAARSVPEARVETWADVDRLDVRPSKGVVKVRANSRWEVQIDTATAEVVQVAFRRSDLIESIHDGSFFFDGAKLWLWLPAGVILLGLWGTGLYLWWLPHGVRRRKRRRLQGQSS